MATIGKLCHSLWGFVVKGFISMINKIKMLENTEGLKFQDYKTCPNFCSSSGRPGSNNSLTYYGTIAINMIFSYVFGIS